jgi:hypothetical protein
MTLLQMTFDQLAQFINQADSSDYLGI